MKPSEKWVRRRRCDLMLSRSAAERAAYEILVSLGYEVIRQKAFYTGRQVFFADLYLPKLRTVVEIDGGYHMTEEQRRKDRNRSSCLRRLGCHILRLSNKDARDRIKVSKKLSVVLV